MNEHDPTIQKILKAIDAPALGWAWCYDENRPISRQTNDRIACGSANRRGKPGSKRTKNRLGIKISVVLPRKDSNWREFSGLFQSEQRKVYMIQKKITDLTATDMAYLSKLTWEPDQPLSVVDQIAALA